MFNLKRFQIAIVLTLLCLPLHKSFAQCNGLVLTPDSFNVPGTGAAQTITATDQGQRCIWFAQVNGPNWVHGLKQNGGTAATPGTGQVSFIVDANPDFVSRNNAINVVPTNGGPVTTALIFQSPATGDFSIPASPGSQSVLPSVSATYTLSINRSGGFGGSVLLSASGQPNGSNITFSPNPATSSSTMTVTTSSGTPTGNFTITIQGQNGNVSKTTTVALQVVDFSLRSCASGLIGQPGGSPSCVLNVNPINGFSGAVTLTASGQPNGANITFNPNPTTGSSTMTVALSGSVAAGTYPITITGTNGTVSRTTMVNLSVVDFTVSARPANSSIAPGGTTSYQITINPMNGFSGTVTLSASGQPSGSNPPTFSPNPATSTSTMTVTSSGGANLGGYPLTITGQNGPTNHTTSATLNVNGPPVAMRFVPVTPCRIADTRNPAGPFGGPSLSGGTFREFDIPNSGCGIPGTATAYSLNITAVPKGGLGFLAAVPCGQQQPLTSNLNSDGRVKAVAAIVPAGTNGGVCLFPTQDTDVILDISGYFVPPTTNPNGLAFYPITPCRVVDTRNATSPLGGPALAGQTTRTFPLLSGACNVPPSAQAYSLNLTALPTNGLGFLTAWAAGQPQPTPSILNAPAGATAANAAIVTAGSNGGISVFTTHDTNLIIDINGYFAPPAPGGLSLFTLTPCRALDTRIPAGSPPLNGMLTLDVTGSGCGASSSSQAYVVNATVIPPGLLGFLELWANGTPAPGTSTLNAFDGAVTSNMAIVSTTNGSINALTSAPSHLVLDVLGYFAP